MNRGRKPFFLLLISFQLVVAGNALQGQNYLKSLAESDKYFRQRVAHFPNGDLLIGDSSVEALRTGSGGRIYMSRMDACGLVKWSRSYERREEYLEFKDLRINAANEIFIYGSAYQGLDEFIFLLKLDGLGNILSFRLFEPETVDHFSYNIDLAGNRLMTYGLILDFGTKKHGFVAMFDQNLNFSWGVKFTPFESSGEARITRDGGFICRSGPYLFKLKQDGALDWAHSLEPDVQNNPIGGPLEVADGYILEAYGEGLGFFYKIGLDGRLLWKSEQFPTKNFPAGMSLLADGRIIASYSDKDAEGHHLNYLLLGADGQVLRRQRLENGQSTKPGRVYQSLGQNGRLVVAANFDATALESTTIGGFLLQSTWPPVDNDCFSWEDLSGLRPNQVAMNFTPLDTAILRTAMELYSNPMITPAQVQSPFSNACLGGPEQNLILTDTLLSCREDWTIFLPGPEFSWTDGQTDNPRIMSRPGELEANNDDCGNLLTHRFRLEKPACDCAVYLPTAFSPNEDGQNDQLEFFSDCSLTEIHYQVYSRWGERVFESRTPGIFWDGRQHGQLSPNGLYLVVIDYGWEDETGNSRRLKISQSVTLLR